MSEPSDSLVAVGDVIRRTLAARTRDHHLIEDLTQETLVRVATVEHRLSPDEQRAYAVVTARNLLASHARGKSVQTRHAHRLVEYAGLDGPEQLTLDREETDALAAALERIDGEDRDLLLRHEAEGTEVAMLAEEAHVSRGAMAMRLARGRANLRLEFLLAFRRVELPTDRCRPVLLALSGGDRRRQEKLDAAGHLRTCAVCAGLARPITERNRRIAGWLLVPAAEGLRRAWRAARNHPVRTTLAAGLVAVAAAAAIAWGPTSEDTSNRPAAAPAARVAATVPSTPVKSAPTDSGTRPAAATPCPRPAPLDRLDTTNAVGCPFTATVMTVTEVPADEGFWATTPGGNPVWIHLTGAGESPVQIEPRQRLSIAGEIAAPRPERAQMGLPAEDHRAARLDYYLEVPFDAVRLAD